MTCVGGKDEISLEQTNKNLNKNLKKYVVDKLIKVRNWELGIEKAQHFILIEFIYPLRRIEYCFLSQSKENVK